MSPQFKSAHAAALTAAALLTCSAHAQSSTDFTGFTPGISVHNQGGWSASNPAWDEEIVDLGGNLVWRVSNAVTSGSFGDMPIAPRPGGVVSDTVNNPSNSFPQHFAGESSTGASHRAYSSSFKFRSATGGAQPGLFVSVSPDNGIGGRNSYVGLSDNGTTGIDVIAYDVDSGGNFVGPTTVATLDYTSWHTIRMEIEFVDGIDNDIARLYVNEALVFTGKSWEQFYRAFQPALHPLGVPVQTLLWRLGGAAAPAVLGGGYYFDDVEVAMLPQADLELTPADTCVEGSTLVVHVDLTRVVSPELVVGGQFFLNYDTSLLQFVSATPGSAPFNLEVYENVNTITGNIDYAVGVIGGGPGTATTPTTMAVLTFNVLSDVCATASDLVRFRTPPSPFPPTRVTNSIGAHLSTSTADLASVRIDSTAPDLVIPSSVTVHADAGVCHAAASTIEAAMLAPASWVFGGDAEVVDDGGNNTLKMDSDADAPGVSYIAHYPTSAFTFAQLTDLSANYKMLNGCFAWGAPRFSVLIDMDSSGTITPADKQVHIYWGTLPNYTDCPPLGVWQSTGNLAAAMDARFDTGQVGGTFYDTRANADALVGTLTVLRVLIAVDGGGANHQSLLVDDIQVNTTVHSFLTAAEATDNCTASPTVVGVRDDSLALTDPYPVGITTITWTATDECGNSTSLDQTVEVLGTSLMEVTVELESAAAGPFTRCITFDLFSGCPDPVHTLETEMTFSSGVGVATIEVPCGSYACITARDRLHTLRRTDEAFHISGLNYVADFTGSDMLIGGNLNDDNVIDILDFGAFVGQFGVTVGASTTCATPYPHADINGNGGPVGSDDYTFIQIHFFQFHELDCCGAFAMGPDGPNRPIVSISLDELRKLGMTGMIQGDLTNDGVLDFGDIQWFAQHGALPCPADFNRDTIASPADIFSFLEVYFMQDLRADVDNNGIVAVTDVMTFLNTWFAGCP